MARSLLRDVRGAGPAVLALLVLFILAMGSRSPVRAGEPATPVTLQLLWTHNAHFGGYYVADKLGLYAQEGLTVRFLEGGPDADLIGSVVDGRARFGVATAAELLIARQAGKPVRGLATIYRRSPSVYVAKADSGITGPADFAGKTIRVSTVDAANFYAMMSRAGIATSEYRVVSLPSDPALFAAGAADVWAVYVNNFAVTLEQAGQRLNYIYPDNHGIHFYADTIFATEETIATSPDLIRRFLRASLKGWTAAVEDPGQVGRLMPLYNPRAVPAVETLKMRATQVLVNTGEDKIGWMREEIWARMAEILLEQKALPQPVDVKDVFTLRFLRDIYGDAAATK